MQFDKGYFIIVLKFALFPQAIVKFKKHISQLFC